MKLIAIRTLENCHPRHLKALQKNHTYYFYKPYSIEGDRLEDRTVFGDEFFLPGRKTRLNLSVIVGKNGSGKSSLMELFIKIINNLSFRQGITRADLEYVPDLQAELFFLTDTYYRVRVFNNRVTAFRYSKKTKRININIPINKLQQDLFYSIVVNNSHYAYNSRLEGNWIGGLFAKNDGYLTPLVLNPFRYEGNIDINIENHLINTRLISNFLLPSKNEEHHFRKLTPLFTARYLKLTLKESKASKDLYTLFGKENEPIIIRLYDLNINHHDLLTKLNSFIPFSYTALNRTTYKPALEYLVYKMVSIAIKYYNHYRQYFDKEKRAFVSTNMEQFFEDLKTDDSHVTLKLRQTINFLRLRKLSPKNQRIDLEKYTKSVVSIGKVRRHWSIFELAELSPPPIFNIEILMQNRKGEIVSFTTLSSGEKQLIYSVSSVLYHLANLNSIYRNYANRRSYQWVNVILEEVELYAHPEMQRVFVQYLLDSISHMQLRMRGINICIFTHSPFVLSDVPRDNLLFLADPVNKQQQMGEFQNFGANIYDMLAQTFFLEKGAMGEFARRRIQSILDLLKKAIKSKDPDILNYHDNILLTINIIGEPLLKQKLLEDYKQLQELKTSLTD